MEVEFESETNGLIRDEGHLDLYLLLSNAQVAAAHVSHLQVNRGVLLRNGVLQVDVLVTTVYYLEDPSALLSKLDSRKDEIRLVEVESREAGLRAYWHFHIASRDVYFGLVNEEL